MFYFDIKHLFSKDVWQNSDMLQIIDKYVQLVFMEHDKSVSSGQKFKHINVAWNSEI